MKLAFVSPKILLTNPGLQYAHQLARQLARQDSLYEFWTGFALSADGWYTQALQHCLPQRWRKKIANRILTGIGARHLRSTPALEWKALKRINQGGSPQKVFHERNRVFQEKIPDSSLRKASALIGFDTASWLLADRAGKLDKPFFLDQSISHPLANQEIMRGVAQRFPQWGETIEERLPQVLACEHQEYQLSTRIVAASSFTKKTLMSYGIAADKIIINPYGVDLQAFYPPESSGTRQRPLRFLFLGLISARKGVPLILEAWRKLALKDAELWLVGPLTESVRALIPELPGLKVMGKFHRQDLPNLLRQCDVLAFPSYCEGFGLVLLEALASGMPIITTDATAGPDLIQDGVEGQLIPTGDLDALCEAVRNLAREPDKLERMAHAARRCAERFSWEAYGDRWQQILQDNA